MKKYRKFMKENNCHLSSQLFTILFIFNHKNLNDLINLEKFTKFLQLIKSAFKNN